MLNIFSALLRFISAVWQRVSDPEWWKWVDRVKYNRQAEKWGRELGKALLENDEEKINLLVTRLRNLSDQYRRLRD